MRASLDAGEHATVAAVAAGSSVYYQRRGDSWASELVYALGIEAAERDSDVERRPIPYRH